MASTNASNSNITGDIKNIKIKDSSEIPSDVALSKSNNSSLVEQDSFYYEKGLELSDEHLNEVKYETDILNEVDNILGTKSSMPSVNILKTPSASTPINTVVKKEIIISNEGESESKVSAYTPTPIKPAKATDEEAGEVNSNITTGENQVLSDGIKKACNNVIRLAPKDLSDEERKKLRAKRFNIIVADSCPIAKKTVVKNASTEVCQNTPNLVNRSTPTYDVLKKRAERFGENVSTVMKSLDYKEKLLKRKLKFLESVTNFKEQEMKKRRAERFSMA